MGAICSLICLLQIIAEYIYPEYYINGIWEASVLLGAVFFIVGYRSENKKKQSHSNT